MSTVLVAIVAYVLFIGWICGRLKEVGDRLLLHDRTPLTPTAVPPLPAAGKRVASPYVGPGRRYLSSLRAHEAAVCSRSLPKTASALPSHQAHEHFSRLFALFRMIPEIQDELEW